MKHPIDKWCERRGVTRGELAKRANTSRQTLWRLTVADGHFSTETIDSIERATDGEVTAVAIVAELSRLRAERSKGETAA